MYDTNADLFSGKRPCDFRAKRNNWCIHPRCIRCATDIVASRAQHVLPVNITSDATYSIRKPVSSMKGSRRESFHGFKIICVAWANHLKNETFKDSDRCSWRFLVELETSKKVLLDAKEYIRHLNHSISGISLNQTLLHRFSIKKKEKEK